MIKAFFILYEIALIGVGIWLCGQLREEFRKWTVVKKRYCLAASRMSFVRFFIE